MKGRKIIKEFINFKEFKKNQGILKNQNFDVEDKWQTYNIRNICFKCQISFQDHKMDGQFFPLVFDVEQIR